MKPPASPLTHTTQFLLRVRHAHTQTHYSNLRPLNYLYNALFLSLFSLFLNHTHLKNLQKFIQITQKEQTKTMSLSSIPLKDMTSSSNNNSLVEEKFCSYYEEWLKQLELHLQQLVLGHQLDYETMVTTFTTHHKEYYTAKWAAAHDDILAFFSPQWASPLESAFTWATGWKPSTVFRVVDSLRKTRAPLTSLAQLSDEQAQKIGELGVKIKLEEQKVDREMERQQVAMGDLKMVELARVSSRVNANESSRVDKIVGVAVKGLFDGLEKVMKMGDYVRLKALKGVLDVLSPRQKVDFLAVFAMLQIQIRKWGKQRALINIANDSSNLSVDNLL